MSSVLSDLFHQKSVSKRKVIHIKFIPSDKSICFEAYSVNILVHFLRKQLNCIITTPSDSKKARMKPVNSDRFVQLSQ